MFSVGQLIDAVDKFAAAHGIKSSDIVVSAGGSMAYHGHRMVTRDIDASVTETIFNQLAVGKEVIHLNPIGTAPGVKMVSFPELKIDVQCGIPPQEDLVQHLDTCWFLTRDALYRQKMAMGRQKDLDDIVRMQLGGYKVPPACSAGNRG